MPLAAYNPSDYMVSGDFIRDIGTRLGSYFEKLPSLIETNRIINENKASRELAYTAGESYIDSLTEENAMLIANKMGIEAKNATEVKEELKSRMPNWTGSGDRKARAEMDPNEYYKEQSEFLGTIKHNLISNFSDKESKIKVLAEQNAIAQQLLSKIASISPSLASTMRESPQMKELQRQKRMVGDAQLQGEVGRQQQVQNLTDSALQEAKGQETRRQAEVERSIAEEVDKNIQNIVQNSDAENPLSVFDVEGSYTPAERKEAFNYLLETNAAKRREMDQYLRSRGWQSKQKTLDPIQKEKLMLAYTARISSLENQRKQIKTSDMSEEAKLKQLRALSVALEDLKVGEKAVKKAVERTEQIGDPTQLGMQSTLADTREEARREMETEKAEEFLQNVPKGAKKPGLISRIPFVDTKGEQVEEFLMKRYGVKPVYDQNKKIDLQATAEAAGVDISVLNAELQKNIQPQQQQAVNLDDKFGDLLGE